MLIIEEKIWPLLMRALWVYFIVLYCEFDRIIIFLLRVKRGMCELYDDGISLGLDNKDYK